MARAPAPCKTRKERGTPSGTPFWLISREGYLPVPDRLTVCGLLASLSFTSSTAERFPVSVGVKVTLTLQVFRAASVLPQVVDGSPKSNGSAPPSVKGSIVRVTFRLFKIITVLAGLVVSTAWGAKASLAGVTTTGSLQFPALPALNILSRSAAERATLNASTSSITPFHVRPYPTLRE